jgi:hypothetical protein
MSQHNRKTTNQRNQRRQIAAKAGCEGGCRRSPTSSDDRTAWLAEMRTRKSPISLPRKIVSGEHDGSAVVSLVSGPNAPRPKECLRSVRTDNDGSFKVRRTVLTRCKPDDVVSTTASRDVIQKISIVLSRILGTDRISASHVPPCKLLEIVKAVGVDDSEISGSAPNARNTRERFRPKQQRFHSQPTGSVVNLVHAQHAR